MINARSLLTIKMRFKIAATVAWLVLAVFLLTQCFNLLNAPDDIEVAAGMSGILVLFIAVPWFLIWLFQPKKEKPKDESKADTPGPVGPSV